MRTRHQNRIGVRLVVWVVFLCTILTFVDTLMQVYLDYRTEIRRTQASVTSYVRYHLPQVTDLVINGNKGSVDSLLREMVSFSGLAYAAVIIDDEIYCQQGTKLACSTGCSIWPLCSAAQQEISTGALEVAAKMKPLAAYLFDGFGSRLFENGVKIFLIGGFTFVIIQVLVTRHLVALSEQVCNLELQKSGEPIRLNRRRHEKGAEDELDEVVNGLNCMRQRAHQAYASLERNEQRLLLFFNATEEAMLGVDEERICTFANDACLSLMGITEYSEIIGKNLDELLCSPVEEKGNEVFCRCVDDSLVEGIAVTVEETPLVLGNGRCLFVSLRTYPVLQNQKVTGALIFINDISERKELYREKSLLTEAVRQVPMMVTICDVQGRIQYVNPMTETLIGYPRNRMVGKSFSSYIDQIDGNCSCGEVYAQVRAGKQWAGLMECYSKSGKLLKFFTVISPVFNRKQEVEYVITVAREVSHEIAVRGELMSTQKMDAVSRLSESFAHEFGNPLYGIRAVLKDLQQSKSCTAHERELLTTALQECEKMQAMVKEFSVEANSARAHDRKAVTEVIAEVLFELNEEARQRDVSVTRYFAPECRDVRIQGASLSIILKNVLKNGMEAMGDGGGILDVRALINDSNKTLEIQVQDTGRGISKEHRELVLEPFFSTKSEVVGTGLGLSVAYWLIRGMGGEISFDSHEGSGTTFRLSLPLEL